MPPMQRNPYKVACNNSFYMPLYYILTGFHNNLEDWMSLGILFLGFNGHLIGH